MASGSSGFSVNQLEVELMEAGKRLSLLPSSVPELLNVLAKIQQILCGVQQLPSKSMQNAMHPSIEALIAKELVRHPDMDVNISVACCISEILRIMAPDAPYNDERMKGIFELAVITFEKLSSASGGCYTKIATVLRTFSSVRLSVLMLDLQLDELVVRIFKQFLTAADSNCSAIVLEMEKIMTIIIEESEQLTLELVSLLVTSVRKDNQIALPLCWKLGEKVMRNCASQLKPRLPEIVQEMGISLHDYSEMVAHICNGASKNETMEAKECALVSNSLGETNPSPNDTCKLTKGAIQKRKGEFTVQTVRCCQQAPVHTIQDDYGDTLSLGNQRLNSETSRKKRRIKPNSLIHKSEGYDHTGKVFLTNAWKEHEKKTLSLSYDQPILYKSEAEVKGKRKRNYTPLKKEIQAPKMARSVEVHGENLVGKRVKVWWPIDEMYYEGVVDSFDHSTKKHKVSYTDGDEEILHLKEEQWELVDNVNALQDSGLTVVKGYKVKSNIAPILEAIFTKHGDIAAKCVFKTSSVRSSFLEVVCEVVKQIQNNNITTIISKIEEIESEVAEAEAANINVSWLRAHLEAFHTRKEATKRCHVLMETISNTILVKKAAKMEFRERFLELLAAKERFEEAERCVKVLDLVEKKVNNNILESKAEEDSWVKPPLL